MKEHWREIAFFPGYSVSDHGQVRTDKSGRILALSQTNFGVVQVGMHKNGKQWHRSVPLLVAKEFIPKPFGAFDTPINLDGDRFNNHIDNLVWRPRWFAVRYNQQFNHPKYLRDYSIDAPIMDLKTRKVSENSFECAKRYGLLEQDLVLSILNRTYTWPTYQEFAVAVK